MKNVFLFVLLAFCVPLDAWCVEEVVKTLAVVNRDVITSKDLKDYCRMISYDTAANGGQLPGNPDEFSAMALKTLIEDKLVLGKALEEKDLVVPDNLVETKITQMRSNFPNSQAFEDSMVQKGISEALLRKRIKDHYMIQYMLQKYVTGNIAVSPAEISEYYNANSDQFATPIKYVIWSAGADEKLLEDIGKTIKEQGLEAVEKAYPGVLLRSELEEKAMRDDIIALLPKLAGGNYAVIKIDGASQLIYLEQVLPAGKLPLDQVKDRIFAILSEKKYRESYNAWIEELKKKSLVRIDEAGMNLER